MFLVCFSMFQGDPINPSRSDNEVIFEKEVEICFLGIGWQTNPSRCFDLIISP